MRPSGQAGTAAVAGGAPGEQLVGRRRARIELERAGGERRRVVRHAVTVRRSGPGRSAPGRQAARSRPPSIGRPARSMIRGTRNISASSSRCSRRSSRERGQRRSSALKRSPSPAASSVSRMTAEHRRPGNGQALGTAAPWTLPGPGAEHPLLGRRKPGALRRVSAAWTARRPGAADQRHELDPAGERRVRVAVGHRRAYLDGIVPGPAGEQELGERRQGAAILGRPSSTWRYCSSAASRAPACPRARRRRGGRGRKVAEPLRARRATRPARRPPRAAGPRRGRRRRRTPGGPSTHRLQRPPGRGGLTAAEMQLGQVRGGAGTSRSRPSRRTAPGRRRAPGTRR